MKPDNSALTPREKQLRDLATAYDSFVDLKHNVEEGTQVCDKSRNGLQLFLSF